MDERRSRLYSRLRQPSSASTVPGTLPVLFFGDLLGAQVATVGLNPSDQEYLTKDGILLAGPAQRFATLTSLGASDRSSLTDEQCAEAVEWMRDYYEPGKPVYGSWFKALSRVVEGFGASFRDRSAAHLDLIQESTNPVWSELSALERETLLDQDLPFLEWEVRAFPITAVICTGKTVSNHVRRQLGVVVDDEGTLAADQVVGRPRGRRRASRRLRRMELSPRPCDRARTRGRNRARRAARGEARPPRELAREARPERAGTPAQRRRRAVD